MRLKVVYFIPAYSAKTITLLFLTSTVPPLIWYTIDFLSSDKECFIFPSEVSKCSFALVGVTFNLPLVNEAINGA